MKGYSFRKKGGGGNQWLMNCLSCSNDRRLENPLLWILQAAAPGCFQPEAFDASEERDEPKIRLQRFKSRLRHLQARRP